MNDITHSSAPNALARQWIDVAHRARVRHTRRVLVTSMLMLVMALGLLQFGAILLWAARTTTWWALLPTGVHALGIGIALGWPVHAGTSLLEAVHGFRMQLGTRFADRVERMRALRTVVAIECAMLFAWPLARFLVTGAPPRWSVTFTTAFCSLAILWPLERIAEAQRAESRRLLDVVDDDIP